MRILGISLGTRDSGVAFISDGQLLHWKTHSFHERWSTAKLSNILVRFDRYLTRFQVSHVVIKIPPASHHSKEFLLLLNKLLELVKYRGCMVAQQTKADIKAHVSEVTNAETLMEYVTRWYPILLPEQAQELAGSQSYHIRMFEAVLSAHAYKEKMNS